MAVHFTERRPLISSKNTRSLYSPLKAPCNQYEINVTTDSEKCLINLFTYNNLRRSCSSGMPRVRKTFLWFQWPVKQMENCPIPQIVTSHNTYLSIRAIRTGRVIYSRVWKLSFRSVTVFTTRVSLGPWWILSIRTIRRDRLLYSRLVQPARIVSCIYGSHFSHVNIARVPQYNLIDRNNVLYLTTSFNDV